MDYICTSPSCISNMIFITKFPPKIFCQCIRSDTYSVVFDYSFSANFGIIQKDIPQTNIYVVKGKCIRFIAHVGLYGVLFLRCFA